MALHCNIDSNGKLVRLVFGILFLLIGLGLIVFWALPVRSVWAWLVSLLVLLGGAFAIFEARAGWCAVRAMGFRTPV